MESKSGLDREGDARDNEPDRADVQHGAAIEGISDGSAPQPKNDERHQTKKAGEAHIG